MIRIANAPCSWGALEFELEGEAPDYVQVLNEIAETGYAGTELGDWGFMPTEPEKLSQEIHGRNLALLGAFVPVFLKDPASHQAGIDQPVVFEEGQHRQVDHDTADRPGAPRRVGLRPFDPIAGDGGQ